MPKTRKRGGVAPARADAAADKAARHRAEPLGIKIAQIDDVHGGKIARFFVIPGRADGASPESITTNLPLRVRNA